MILDGDCTLSVCLDGELVNTCESDGDVGVKMIVNDPPIYQGDTEITPTQSTQVLLTEGMQINGDIVINPIPNNYGRIGWNGSVLTVS